jgi:hypothetical protein
MERLVKKEWLDDLAADDPLAVRSRRDIQRLNLLTGHDRIMADALSAALDGCAVLRIVELGSGNGRFLLSVARRLNGRFQNVEATLVDRADGFHSDVCDELKKLGWNAAIEIADAFVWLRQAAQGCDVIIANQFFHQFQPHELIEMFNSLKASTRILIAVEPRRGFWSLLCSRFVGLVGCGAVTRYDAPVSVRAGFAGCELSAFWPDKKNWELIERRAGLFSHLFIARKKA